MTRCTLSGIRTPRPRHSFAWLLLCLISLLPVNRLAWAESVVRVAALEFGTGSWELDVIKRHGLDREAGFDLEVMKLAGKQATMVALQAGAVDMAITDWIWVSRQRAEGKGFTFVPFTTALGALVVAPDAKIEKLTDLKGKRLGIAGGPIDKSWLLLQALALQDDNLDLNSALTPVFAAPPLLNEQLKQARIDAVLNFWPYVARLQSIGMKKLIGIDEVTRALGIKSDVPFVGYVFDEKWAVENHSAALGFFQAAAKAKQIMQTSDQAWEELRPLMKAPDEATFIALREGFRAGIPSHWGANERQDAEKLFDILYRLGGKQLVGETTRLSEGTFWPDVTY